MKINRSQLIIGGVILLALVFLLPNLNQSQSIAGNPDAGYSLDFPDQVVKDTEFEVIFNSNLGPVGIVLDVPSQCTITKDQSGVGDDGLYKALLNDGQKIYLSCSSTTTFSAKFLTGEEIQDYNSGTLEVIELCVLENNDYPCDEITLEELDLLTADWRSRSISDSEYNGAIKIWRGI